MSTRSDALAVVPDTYRPMPSREEQTASFEVSTCQWCEFSDGTYCNSPAHSTKGQVDKDKMIRFGEALDMEANATDVPREDIEAELTDGERRWVAMFQGECPGYRPAIWTRLLRWVGLRRPVMR